MKILVVSHEFPPIGGGGANACYFLTKCFADMGHRVDIVTANYKNLPTLQKLNGVNVYRLNSARKNKEHCGFGEMLSYLMKAMTYSEKLHKTNKYDICLVFFGIPSGPIGYRLKMKYKLPYIIRFGGGDIPGFQERFLTLYKLISPAIKKIWKHADARVANSEGLRRLALDFTDDYRFIVIPNGVDTEYFKPALKSENSDVNCKNNKSHIRILFVSRLIERKGLQHILPYLDKIANNAHEEVTLTVVGDGPYRENLERIAKDCGVSSKVSFVGQKSREEILSFYQEADIFILPSSKEGMPNVVLEAMACGLPIVMTPCQGAEELIDGNGIVSDISDFVDNVCRLISDSDLRLKFGEVSRERTVNMFGWKSIADSYIKLMGQYTL